LTQYDGQPRPVWQREGVLKIGCFGAIRPLKNQISAAAAAIQIARTHRSNLEFWISGERTEGGGQTCETAIRKLFNNVPGATLKVQSWVPWPKFRDVVRCMNLLIHPSYTESFNMVTADGIAEGVPSVVSNAIDWAPDYWQAKSDNVLDIARVGSHLLTHPLALNDGLKALQLYNKLGVRAWKDWVS
jgi:glycosyltransferase involved in cell wall biosynthesis